MGNRTAGVRYGVVFPKAEALRWIRSLRLFPQGCRISFMSIRRILKHLEKRLNPTGKESLWEDVLNEIWKRNK